MAQKSRTIYMPFRGLGSSFIEADLTPEYCTKLLNWNIVSTGALETINTFTCDSNVGAASDGEFTNARVTAGTFPYSGYSVMSMHELLASPNITGGITPHNRIYINQIGRIITKDFVGATTLSYVTYPHRIRSAQFEDKLILVDGTSRNFYTTDGSGFSPLLALLEEGQISSTSASSTGLIDSDVTNWITQTHVNNNDLVRNLTKKGFAIITGVSTAGVTHTRIDASALGVGLLTAAATSQESGDFYQIEDMVELNIIPTLFGTDNVAVAGTNTSATGIYFTAASQKFNWVNSQIRAGDYILNTTRNAATAVTAITTSVLRTEGISTMVAGDTLVFLKSAMPIASYAHVHFNRLYLIDSRDPKIIRISGPGDPQDMTVDAGTLDATSFKYGAQQSEADEAICLASYQRFLAIGGLRNIYLFDGTDPIADVSSNPTGSESSSIDFNITATFPGGVRGPDSIKSIGNDLLYIGHNGVQVISQSQDSTLLNASDISEGIKGEFIRDFYTCHSVFHYPEKMWLGFHFINQHVTAAPSGYVLLYNYGPYFGSDRQAEKQGVNGQFKSGFWTKVNTSAWDNRCYFVDSSGAFFGISLVPSPAVSVASQDARLMIYNNSAASDQDASASAEVPSCAFSCVIQTSWLTLNEPRESRTTKDGTYITPMISYDRYVSGGDVSGANVTFIACAADTLGRPAQNNHTYTHSSDSFTIRSEDFFDQMPNTIAGSALASASAFNPEWKDYFSEKFPLMWHGQKVRFTIIASVRETKVTLSNFNVEFNESGAP